MAELEIRRRLNDGLSAEAIVESGPLYKMGILSVADLVRSAVVDSQLSSKVGPKDSQESIAAIVLTLVCSQQLRLIMEKVLLMIPSLVT